MRSAILSSRGSGRRGAGVESLPADGRTGRPRDAPVGRTRGVEGGRGSGCAPTQWWSCWNIRTASWTTKVAGPGVVRAGPGHHRSVRRGRDGSRARPGSAGFLCVDVTAVCLPANRSRRPRQASVSVVTPLVSWRVDGSGHDTHHFLASGGVFREARVNAEPPGTPPAPVPPGSPIDADGSGG